MSLEAVHEPDQSPGLLLWRLTMAWQARQRVALKAHSLTHVQFVLLAILVAADDAPLPQSTLAARGGIDPMMTSQVLRALEANGLVTRAVDDGDARVRLAATTPAGVKAANAAVVDVEEVDRAVFSPLGDRAPVFARDLASLLEHAGPSPSRAGGRHAPALSAPCDAPAR